LGLLLISGRYFAGEVRISTSKLGVTQLQSRRRASVHRRIV